MIASLTPWGAEIISLFWWSSKTLLKMPQLAPNILYSRSSAQQYHLRLAGSWHMPGTKSLAAMFHNHQNTLATINIHALMYWSIFHTAWNFLLYHKNIIWWIDRYRARALWRSQYHMLEHSLLSGPSDLFKIKAGVMTAVYIGNTRPHRF